MIPYSHFPIIVACRSESILRFASNVPLSIALHDPRVPSNAVGSHTWLSAYNDLISRL